MMNEPPVMLLTAEAHKLCRRHGSNIGDYLIDRNRVGMVEHDAADVLKWLGC